MLVFFTAENCVGFVSLEKKLFGTVTVHLIVGICTSVGFGEGLGLSKVEKINFEGSVRIFSCCDGS